MSATATDALRSCLGFLDEMIANPEGLDVEGLASVKAGIASALDGDLQGLGDAHATLTRMLDGLEDDDLRDQLDEIELPLFLAIEETNA